MRYAEITEGAAEDLSVAAEAKRIVSVFVRHVAEAGLPFPQMVDVDYRHLPKFRLYYLEAAKIGLPEYNNLHIGFAAKYNGVYTDAQGALSRGTNQETGERFFWAYIIVDQEAINDKNLIWKVKYDDLVHEIIHYLDYNRKGAFPGKAFDARTDTIGRRKALGYSERMAAYYNDPLEVNAFFQQALSLMLDNITFEYARTASDQKRFSTILYRFPNFGMLFWNYAHKGFVAHANEDTRRRVNKRLYKLWKLFKEEWPDIEAIKTLVDRMRF